MKKKGKKSINSIVDYIKTIKKADREAQLEKNIGWAAKEKIHPSKKTYNRKNRKINIYD